MRQGKEWSETLLKLVGKLNNFDFHDAYEKHECIPFFIGEYRVGLISPIVLQALEKYKHVFQIVTNNGIKSAKKCASKALKLHDCLTTVEERSEAIAEVLSDLREKNIFRSLNGWRNETYGIYYRRAEPPLCHVERSGCALFGFIQYGVHINGYTYKDGQLMMWIGKRSSTKPTYPDMLDNMCGGGLTSGLGVLECAIKECQEEASIDDEHLQNLKSVGAISYCYQGERGIQAETVYIYDLEVPPVFVPQNADGEVAGFTLYTMEQIQNLIMSGEFKPNCALVVLDFMMRHGLVTHDDEPNYAYLVEKMHISLQPRF